MINLLRCRFSTGSLSIKSSVPTSITARQALNLTLGYLVLSWECISNGFNDKTIHQLYKQSSLTSLAHRDYSRYHLDLVIINHSYITNTFISSDIVVGHVTIYNYIIFLRQPLYTGQNLQLFPTLHSTP